MGAALAGIGVVGLAFGFAGQDSLANVIVRQRLAETIESPAAPR